MKTTILYIASLSVFLTAVLLLQTGKEQKTKQVDSRKWLYIFLAWTVVALFFASSFILQNQISQQPIEAWRAAVVQLASAYGWFFLMPVILWLANHFPLDRGTKMTRNIIVNIAGGIFIVLIHVGWDAFFQPLLNFRNRQFETYFSAYAFQFFLNFHWSCIVYLQINGIIYGFRYYHKFRAGELRASQLETRLAQSRLKVLQMQLHPHFLFNTHNAIAELIHKDPNTAEKMVENLSDLLRMSLDKLNAGKVSLQQELEFLDKYLQIEQIRFQERLKVKKYIGADTLDAAVPNMILQPLIENAIKHGISPLIKGGTIEVSASRKNGNLHLQVADNGIGASEIMIEGIGISNTRARLKHLYEDSHQFSIRANKSRGFIVDIIIPYKSFKSDKTELNFSGQYKL